MKTKKGTEGQQKWATKTMNPGSIDRKEREREREARCVPGPAIDYAMLTSRLLRLP